MADRVDVVVIGAGLAGLRAAIHLQAAGREVRVLEASDAVGGRIRTDEVDGLLLDRGFQLFNPAYPAASNFDRAALDLKTFRPGVAVALDDERHLVGDPRRWPAVAVSTVRAPIGSPLEKIRFARWALAAATLPAARLLEADDRSLVAELTAHGLDGRIARSVIRPFLSGVLADGELASSTRLARLLIRAFVRGTPGLPAAGMRALPEQLAARLAPGTIAFGTAVESVTAGRVQWEDGELSADAVVVAADPVTAAELTGLPRPAMRGLTTYYHRAPVSPSSHAVLHIDGQGRGPIVNCAVLSDAAPSYSERGALIASTVLGADDTIEAIVREQAGLIYGVDSSRWEHVRTYAIAHALPAQLPPLNARQPVELGDGLFVAGDHRDTASIQGALVSGARAAAAVLQR
jgi:hypothetical protein